MAAENEQTVVVEALADALNKMAGGDLTYRIEIAFDGRYQKLKDDFNQAITCLQDTLRAISTSMVRLHGSTDEIARGSDDLARRAEQQATNLDHTANALDELTATVQKSAAGAAEVAEVASKARHDAENSSAAMRETMAVMDDPQFLAAHRRGDLGHGRGRVPDQPARNQRRRGSAHAGDAGKGFAVVANEVRGLAQRSADAAKDIRALIAASSKQIASGVGSVGQTGESLQRIVKLIETVDQLVSEFATSTQEQSKGLQSISSAASDMNHVTQQDAAAIEESNTSTRALKTEMDQLAQLIGQFDVGQPAEVAASLHAPPRMHAVA